MNLMGTYDEKIYMFLLLVYPQPAQPQNKNARWISWLPEKNLRPRKKQPIRMVFLCVQHPQIPFRVLGLLVAALVGSLLVSFGVLRSTLRLLIIAPLGALCLLVAALGSLVTALGSLVTALGSLVFGAAFHWWIIPTKAWSVRWRRRSV
jgi:hypothetical protein